MEHRLILMRHAKSDWAAGSSSDHQRPLNKRGRSAARRVGQLIADAGWTPDLVLCSTATRTRETWERMRKAFPVEVRVENLDSLYLAGMDDLAAALQDIPEQYRTALALGHNPGWQEAVYEFTGEAVAMKTAYAALMTADSSSWTEASELRGSWQLVNVVQP